MTEIDSLTGSDQPKGQAQPMRVQITAKFGTCPEVAPQGAFILTREGSHLSEIERGDWISIDGRWRQVTVCTQVQGEVTLSFGLGAADVSAPASTRVFLARVISCRTVAAHREVVTA